MWISRKEYAEHGNKIIECHCNYYVCNQQTNKKCLGIKEKRVRHDSPLHFVLFVSHVKPIYSSESKSIISE